MDKQKSLPRLHGFNYVRQVADHSQVSNGRIAVELQSNRSRTVVVINALRSAISVQQYIERTPVNFQHNEFQ